MTGNGNNPWLRAHRKPRPVPPRKSTHPCVSPSLAPSRPQLPSLNVVCEPTIARCDQRNSRAATIAHHKPVVGRMPPKTTGSQAVRTGTELGMYSCPVLLRGIRWAACALRTKRNLRHLLQSGHHAHSAITGGPKHVSGIVSAELGLVDQQHKSREQYHYHEAHKLTLYAPTLRSH